MKRDWVATPSDLSTLLEWLGDIEGAGAGEAYVVMHRRLASFFARKGCRTAEDLADETLTRVARRLHEAGEIIDVAPAQYCYIVARFVFLEHLRSPELHDVPVGPNVADRPPVVEVEGRDRLLTCLDDCLGALDGKDRGLILDYYAGARTNRIGNRRHLALKLGLSPNAMSIRACRLRERLRACVSRCAPP
jgi:DNA-directed RNA polymerase specialized sigma24 family protein